MHIAAFILAVSLANASRTAETQPSSQPATDSAPASQPTLTPAALRSGYRNNDQTVTALQELAAAGGPNCKLTSLARTAGGRDLWALQLASGDGPPPEKRLGLLIVAGIDAELPASSETALRVAEALVRAQKDGSPAGALLRERVVYVVPRACPDGVEAFFRTPVENSTADLLPVDDDRDGRADEDGPDDLNGDGWISVLRAPDPQGSWMPDPDEPRLLRKADPAKGERGIYRLLFEGIDNDGDGVINEDGPGGVDFDRNWPHLYEPGTVAGGVHQLSAPETRALADFVLEHPNIAAAIVFGRNDNLVKPPEEKDRDSTGQAFRGLHPDDLAVYKHVSEKYKALNEKNTVPGCRPDGALYAWLYSQQGIPTFALRLGRTDTSAGEAVPAEAAPESADKAGDQPGTTPPPVERPRRGRRRAPPAAAPTEAPTSDRLVAAIESNDANKRWLAYCDEPANQNGFRDWTDVTHPEFGRAQVGGFVPGFKDTPPTEELDGIVARQVEFIAWLSEQLPAPAFGPARVRDAGGGLWEIELHVRNGGGLPTHLAIARQIQTPPIMVRPALPADRIVGGPPGVRVGDLPGGGKAVSLRWLVRGKPGERVTFRGTHRVYGEFSTDVTLAESSPAQEKP